MYHETGDSGASAMTVTVGYDVGGAHLKVARVEAGRVTAVAQFACPLWRGLDQLDAALSEAASITHGAVRHAVTMTGELCELFATRHDGVMALSSHLSQRLGAGTRFYMGLKGFGDDDAVASQTDSVASANFLATAQTVAKLRLQALLIDMGSTTTDIIACDRPQGLSDAERLQTGELVYTGFTRTPVPSITTRGVLAGQWQGLARDTFATMADVRRVLGELPDDVDLHDTADGRGKSVEESLARLARGFGRDAEIRHLTTWQVAAAHIQEEQLRSVIDGALQVLSRPGLKVTSVVAAGIGAPVADVIAQRLGLPCTMFGDLIGADARLSLSATRCAPAVSVAMLQDA
jgi:(4-(4-[2-(gamma-L-glutamylamino)ethyl]phenoxymethyl)furan-2-yl)methanamine synthase